ncbi:MAG: TapY2 family type IVa secretion system protein [Colwellia sp.]|nr:TapY2 family type IVa secretion system protein [Colwellia sp.]
MNKINGLLLTTLLGTMLLTSSLEAQTQKSYQQKYREAKGEQVSIKCHIEYSGGGEAIRSVIGQFNNPNQAKQVFQGREIRVGANKVSKRVYKVNECVNKKDEFTSARAKRLDKNTAR